MISFAVRLYLQKLLRCIFVNLINLDGGRYRYKPLLEVVEYGFNQFAFCGTHQANAQAFVSVGSSVSISQASLFGGFHTSPLIGLRLKGVFIIQHVKSVLTVSERSDWLIGSYESECENKN